MNLQLLQLGDSALPIGGYSHSWGLEAAISQRVVSDAGSLERWVRFWLHDLLAPFEGILVAAGCRAAADRDWPIISRANELLRVGLMPPTLRLASREMGEQLLRLAEGWPWAAEHAAALRALADRSPTRPGNLLSVGGDSCDSFRARSLLSGACSPDSIERARNEDRGQAANPLGGQGAGTRPPDPEWHHAVVFATLAAAAPATPAEAVAVYLHQAALGMIGAGVRAIPIGHTHGQQILARLHDDIRQLADEVSERDLETAGSFCPAYEILCHAQGRLYTRLFRS